MIGLVVALVAAAVLGGLVDRVLGAPGLDPLERFGRALMFGLGGLGALSMLADSAGLGVSPFGMLMLWAAAVAGLWFRLRRGGDRARPGSPVDGRSAASARSLPPEGALSRVLGFALLLPLGAALFSVVRAGWQRPAFQFDALTRWIFKAKVLAFDGTLMGPVSSDPAFAFTHQRYPPLVSHVANLPALVNGSFDDRLASALFPWFAVALALVLYGIVARATSRRWVGAAAALWVACLPPSLYLVFPPPGAGAASAMADIPLSLFLTGGGLAAAAALVAPEQRRLAWEAGLLLGFATLVKNEALPFVAGVALGLLALGGARRFALTARVVLPASVIYVAAWGLRAQGFPALDEHYPAQLNPDAVTAGLARLGPILAALRAEVASADTLHRWNLTWPAALVLLGLAGRTLLRRDLALLLILIVWQLSAYVLAYTVTAWSSPAAEEALAGGDPVVFLLNLTLARLLLHLAPLLVATAVLAAPLAGVRPRSGDGSGPRGGHDLVSLAGETP